MAQYDMLDEHPGKRFSSNVATSLLVRGKEPSLGHMAAHQINTPKLKAWKVLPEAIKTGQTAFILAHNGETMYQVSTGPYNTLNIAKPVIAFSACWLFAVLLRSLCLYLVV